MPYYRLYFKNPVSGRFQRFEEVFAADDVEAVRITSEKRGAQPIELWCRDRQVQQFEPLQKAAE